jgi:hypothetical protein
MFDPLSTAVGSVGVITTNGRGHTPEELADMATDKIVYVGNRAPPVISEQANAFKDTVRALITYYMKAAITEHNATVANRLKQAGFAELIPLLKD